MTTYDREVMTLNEISVTVIIPAYNEEKTIGDIVKELKQHGYDVLVIDDGSVDHTAKVAREAGAKVIRHSRNRGYLEALRTGFKEVSGDIIITMDADGQHQVKDIPKLIEPILEGEADLVMGVRNKLSLSEKLITKITNLKVKVSDASTGFRALKRKFASKMKLRGICTCGTFVLEAYKLGAKVAEVRIKSRKRRFGKSKIRKRHAIQALIVMKEILT